MKILYFFLFLWVIFALLDPDPDPATQINADPDPDPKPCIIYFCTNSGWQECIGHSLANHLSILSYPTLYLATHPLPFSFFLLVVGNLCVCLCVGEGKVWSRDKCGERTLFLKRSNNSVAGPWHFGTHPDPRIHTSLTNGSWSGSCYFRQWPSRHLHKIIFFLITFWR